MSDFVTHCIECEWPLPRDSWGLTNLCGSCELKDAIRRIPESKDPPTCRHGRTLLVPCSMCERFNKQ